MNKLLTARKGQKNYKNMKQENKKATDSENQNEQGFTKLSLYSEQNIQRGSILRCKGNYPYEDVVDFLICEPFTLEKCGARLVVASGYKAGLTLCILPSESIPEGVAFGLKTDWLISNWNKWCYECSIDDVWILENYIPQLLPEKRKEI
jgi:hypothetical protein